MPDTVLCSESKKSHREVAGRMTEMSDEKGEMSADEGMELGVGAPRRLPWKR